MGLYRIGGVNSKVQKLMTTVFCKYILSQSGFIISNVICALLCTTCAADIFTSLKLIIGIHVQTYFLNA